MIVTAVNATRDNKTTVLAVDSVRTCGSFLVEMNRDRSAMIVSNILIGISICTTPGNVKADMERNMLAVGWSPVDVALWPDLKLLVKMYDDPKLFKSFKKLPDNTRYRIIFLTCLNNHDKLIENVLRRYRDVSSRNS